MNAISTDLRARIIHAVQHEHNTPQQAAERFLISRASVYRYLEQHRNQGSLSPAKRTRTPRGITVEDEAQLKAQLETRNDATLEEHCQQWQEDTGKAVSVSTMHRAFQRLKLSRKKDDPTR
jgi:transposase